MAAREGHVAQLPKGGWYVHVLEADNAALRQHKQELQRLVSQLQQDREQRAAEQQQRLISQLQQDREQQQRDSEQMQRLISQLQQDNAQLLQNAVALTAVLLQQNKQQEECISAHTACSQAMSMQLVRSSAAFAAAQNELNWVSQELDHYKAECASLSEQVCSVKEQLRADITAVEDQLQHADNDKTRLTEQLSLLQEQIQSPPPTPCAAIPCVSANSSSPAHTITSSAAQQVSNMVTTVPQQSSQQSSPSAAQPTETQQRATKKEVPKATGPRWRL